MTARQLPADGRDATDRIAAGGAFPFVALSFKERVKTLLPFTERFAFFTPALLYLWGRLDSQVLWHFLELQGRRVNFYHWKSTWPLFQGLETPDGNRDWNYVLWAVEQEDWPPLVDHILAAVAHSAEERLVIRYGLGELLIRDPLISPLQTGLATFPLQVFGVRTNRATVTLRPAAAFRLPQPTWHPPDKQCKMYADLMFGQAPDQAVDLLRVEGNHENSVGIAPGQHGGSGQG